ncbi:MAG: hypothetical protein M0D55_04685 [Elusimicrobiota bacterium]|nr:MAG: hypothetical protein M0D55_04685 [Elusimicrobiota bacterium]
MSETENKVVLFADMLGFASLTESHPLDVDRLRAHDRFISYIDNYLGTPENPLTDKFFRFHNGLKNATSIANMRHPLTAISFSDSAFIATTHLHEVVAIAADLLRYVISSGVPVRAGIAYGSFATLRFKSDITSDGGDHSVQFLGTAVVRATVAEKCGIKGFRILLHPSVAPLLNDPRHNPPSGKDSIRILACADGESNKAGVQHEVDYWDFPITREASAWRSLQDMWDRTPLSEQNHYEATAGAIDRMRIGRGRAPLDKLRRRTLPK